MNEKVSLYYNQITIRLQSDYNQLQSMTSSFTSWKHTVQAIPSKKKKRNKAKEKERIRRKKGKRWKKGEEEKGMERVCSEGKRKGRIRCGRKDEEEGE